MFCCTRIRRPPRTPARWLPPSPSHPGDPGTGPHRHSGPVFGYVLDGEILFELEGDEPYPVKAGEAFWEPGFDVVHYQAVNLRSDIASKFVVFMLCAPDVPMM